MPRMFPAFLRTREAVWAAVTLLVVAQTAFRAWAVYPAWFYGDDYRLLAEARGPLSAGELVAPYDSQLMPLGRFLAWLAARPEPVTWSVLATTSLALQVLASAACAWMLATLFGWRWRVVVLLAVYLSTAITMPAFLWWAASLNQLPMQAVFFAAVATWVRYLRERRARWLVATTAVLCVGLLCYVKVLLVVVVLAALALGWFAEGGPVRRTAEVLRRSWPAVLTLAVVTAVYLGTYLSRVPQAAGDPASVGAGDLAEEMLGRAFVTGALGGPWRWDDRTAPVALADAPTWAVAASWAVAALVVTYLALRRTRTVRAWALLAGYLLADYLLLLTTRATVVGAAIGSEYRYLTDSACVLVLALGLATCELRGAPGSSAPRTQPLLTRAAPWPVIVALATAVVGSGLWSSTTYAGHWHDQHPGRSYLGTTLAGLELTGAIDLAPQSMPPEVTAMLAPYNSTDRVLPLLSRAPRFPEATPDLNVLTEDGRLAPALMEVATTTRSGTVEGCGWLVGPAGATLPLRTEAIDRDWWLRVRYLSSQDTGVTVTAGAGAVETELRRGLGSVWVRADGPFDAVVVSGLDPEVTLCVDAVDVGTLVPGLGAPIPRAAS